MAWSTLWLWAVTLAGSSAVAPGLAGTRVHTIEMDIAWVDANVQRTDVPAGATKAGEAFARALKTDVRAALGASTDSAVGLRIRIDATTLPTISLYRRVAFRRMRVLDDSNGAGATCESTCYDATGNESCPTVTYLEIVGNRSSGPGLNLPVLRPMKPEDSLLPVPPIFGLFYVDVATNATANGSLSCGVSYESPPHRNKVSSPTLFLVLRNIVISNTARLPAVLVRTYVMHATVATRAVSFLAEGVTFKNNSGRALLLEGAGNVLAHVNNSRFEWNAGGALAINQPALTPSPTSITRARLAGGRVEVHVETCTFHENGIGVTRASVASFHK